MQAEYDNLVRRFGSEANIPTTTARDALIDLQNRIRSIIEANPNVKINDLIL